MAPIPIVTAVATERRRGAVAEALSLLDPETLGAPSGRCWIWLDPGNWLGRHATHADTVSAVVDAVLAAGNSPTLITRDGRTRTYLERELWQRPVSWAEPTEARHATGDLLVYLVSLASARRFGSTSPPPLASHSPPVLYLVEGPRSWLASRSTRWIATASPSREHACWAALALAGRGATTPPSPCQIRGDLAVEASESRGLPQPHTHRARRQTPAGNP